VKKIEIKKLDFESIYFDLYELSSGIYAAITVDKLPSSTAGIFDLGNYLVIFDTLMDPFATDDLIKASKELTKKDPTFIINSHYHMDHLFGNRKFPLEIPIISSAETLSTHYTNLEAFLTRFKGIAERELKRIKEEIGKETEANKILEMNNDIKTYNDILGPEFEIRPPDFIINDSFIIEGTEKKVQLIYIGDAHTPGDLLAYFEKEKICFMGDLLFQETDPNWATTTDPAPVPANAEKLRDTLLEYREKDIEVFVPGHGKLCTKKELKENADFFEKYFIKKKES